MPWGAAIGGAVALGGAAMDKEAADEANASMMGQTQEARDYVERMGSRANERLMALFPAAAAARQYGNQGALDVQMDSLGMQTGLLQGGNVAAQNQQIQTLPQVQNALMGNPVNTNFQAYQAEMPQFSATPQLQDSQQGYESLLALQPRWDEQDALRLTRQQEASMLAAEEHGAGYTIEEAFLGPLAGLF